MDDDETTLYLATCPVAQYTMTAIGKTGHDAKAAVLAGLVGLTRRYTPKRHWEAVGGRIDILTIGKAEML